jgi:hypothetical protein
MVFHVRLVPAAAYQTTEKREISLYPQIRSPSSIVTILRFISQANFQTHGVHSLPCGEDYTPADYAGT